jgi:hypothetical protein
MQILPELMELCCGVFTPPSAEEVRPDSHESSDVASPPCLGLEKCNVVDSAVSLSRLCSTGRWFLLVMGFRSLDCSQRCLERSSLEKFAIFSSPWLLPTLDPQLADGCPHMW